MSGRIAETMIGTFIRASKPLRKAASCSERGWPGRRSTSGETSTVLIVPDRPSPAPWICRARDLAMGLLFPDGTLPPRWRMVARAYLAVRALIIAISLGWACSRWAGVPHRKARARAARALALRSRAMTCNLIPLIT